MKHLFALIFLICIFVSCTSDDPVIPPDPISLISPGGVEVEVFPHENGVYSYIARDGEITFEIETRFSPNSFEITERSTVDELTMTVTRSNDRIYEQYVINGHQLKIDYPQMSKKEFNAAHYRWKSGRNPDPEMTEVFEKFSDFYLAYYPASLDANKDGQELIAATTNYGDELMKACDHACKRANFVDWYCAVVAVGTGIKCVIMPLNPICWAGAIVTVACGFWAIFRLATSRG